jgi:hypothetical protein
MSRKIRMIDFPLFLTAVLWGFVSAAATTGIVAATSEKTNFSGDWVFNPEKSKLEIKVELESATFTIDHKEPDFRFSRVFVIGGKDNALAWALTTDGKETVEEEPGQTLHSRLYWDGDVLVFDVRIVLKDGREATNVVRYSLRDGGRTFVAEEKFRGPVLKYDNLWVADRKS